MKTILLDTNILIKLNDGDSYPSEDTIGVLSNAPGNCEFFVHPIQQRDISHDENAKRRKRLEGWIGQYKTLEDPPVFDLEYFRGQGWRSSNDNDFVDNTLLACVVEPIVEHLVTEDKNIHAKAERSGVAGRVLTLRELREMLQPKADMPKMACIEEKPCHTLRLTSSFFDSLRNDYPGFDDWFRDKCARKQRRCWKVTQCGELLALCIYKEERGDAIDDTGFVPDGKTLKLCTLKVSDTTQGIKMGERLLYTAFTYSRTRALDYIYLTVFEDKQPHLIKLLKDFGFERKGACRFGDRAYGKFLHAPTAVDASQIEKGEFIRNYYPSFKSTPDVGKYLVPILPEYHERLFPDISNLKGSLLQDTLGMYGSESNAIRKAYICNASITRLAEGDVLVFYRSRDRMEADTIGVITRVFRSNDVKTIMSAITSRTVYSRTEVAAKANSRKGALVICFDLIRHFSRPVPLRQLEGMGAKPGQSIRGLSEEAFAAIMERSDG